MSGKGIAIGVTALVILFLFSKKAASSTGIQSSNTDIDVKTVDDFINRAVPPGVTKVKTVYSSVDAIPADIKAKALEAGGRVVTVWATADGQTAPLTSLDLKPGDTVIAVVNPLGIQEGLAAMRGVSLAQQLADVRVEKMGGEAAVREYQKTINEQLAKMGQPPAYDLTKPVTDVTNRSWETGTVVKTQEASALAAAATKSETPTSTSSQIGAVDIVPASLESELEKALMTAEQYPPELGGLTEEEARMLGVI